MRDAPHWRHVAARTLLAALVVLVPATVAACATRSDGGGSADEAGSTSEPGTPPARAGLDEIQLLGAHDAYHLAPEPALRDALADVLPELVANTERSQPPLTEQLDAGLRSFELDVYEDPEGGRYGAPAAVDLLDLAPIDPAMSQPGFKVLRVQEVDYRSTCLTLVACLTELRTWSDAHPDHLPIVVHVEVQDSTIPDPLGLGFVRPIPASTGTFGALEAEIRSTLGDDKMVTPAEVRGDRPTLRDAVVTGGWPDVDGLRGRFVLTLDDTGTKRDLYRQLHPDVDDRVLFVDAVPPDDDAAFTVLDDPIVDGDRIRARVAAGMLVRTRADADAVEARSGDTTRRDAAIASGAQIISTDFAREDPRYPGYVVALPGGPPARCNPVSVWSRCNPEALSNG